MKKLIAVLMVLGAVVGLAAAQSKKVLDSQIAEIKANGSYEERTDKKVVTVSYSDNGILQMLSFRNENLKAKDGMVESLAVMNAGGTEYIVNIQIERSNPFPNDYTKYCVVFVGMDAESQLRFSSLGASPASQDGKNYYIVSGTIEKSELERMKKAGTIQVVLMKDGEFYDYERDNMGVNNFKTNKLFQTALKEFFK